MCHFSNAEGVIVPGCLGHPSDQAASNLLHSLVTSKHKVQILRPKLVSPKFQFPSLCDRNLH